jgi:hypothetical protein
MIARNAPKRQASYVARRISSPKRANNLQAKEKIFSQSVALQQNRLRWQVGELISSYPVQRQLLAQINADFRMDADL